MIKCLVLSRKNYLYDVLSSLPNFTDNISFFNSLTLDQSFDLVVSDSAKKTFRNLPNILLENKPIIISDVIQQLHNFIEHKSKIFSFCDINLDILTRSVKYNSLQIQLTELECKILTALINAKSNIVSKKEIKTSILNYCEDTETSTIENHIYHLRIKLTNFNIPISIDNQSNAYKLKSLA